MPTILGPSFSLSYANTPPGMSLQDNLIWQRFRMQQALDYTAFYANVRVGEGTKPLPNFDLTTAKMLQLLTQHRIDIILIQGNIVHLVEVRNNAGSGALGTILTNSSLYLKDPVLGTTIRKLILTNTIDSDSLDAAKQQGVDVKTV